MKTNRNRSRWFCLLLLSAFLGADVSAQDPGRVANRRDGETFTVRTAEGEILRGGVVSIYKYQRTTIQAEGKTYYPTDPAYWDAMKKEGLNAVRLVFFDPWQRSHGDPGSTKPYPHANLERRSEARVMLEEIDKIVDLAAQRGMYVMINYHDTGGYRDPNYRQPAGEDRKFSYRMSMRYLTRFWDWVAPKYAGRTHVFYELANEPVRWHPDDYKAEHLRDFAKIYQQIRQAAPETHVALCTFPTVAGFNRSMLDVANELSELGIDFDNASIAFHPYKISKLPHSTEPIRQLMTKYAVINSEQNFPASIDDGFDDPDAVGFDGDLMGVQSMERLGISWFHWNVAGPEEFQRNMRGILIPDAKEKGYAW